ncbi:hypothetical protein [Hyphomicrobium sp. 2TAF46]|uniref:hypothetical protein n=1 Tax=Hyphomicrobium sp. 2TAF46 TaxID=3233019 RepID=UPI003F9119F7
MGLVNFGEKFLRLLKFAVYGRITISPQIFPFGGLFVVLFVLEHSRIIKRMLCDISNVMTALPVFINASSIRGAHPHTQVDTNSLLASARHRSTGIISSFRALIRKKISGTSLQQLQMKRCLSRSGLLPGKAGKEIARNSNFSRSISGAFRA